MNLREESWRRVEEEVGDRASHERVGIEVQHVYVIDL